MIDVVISDVKGIIVDSGQEVLVRHSKYGTALKKRDSDARLIILTTGKSNIDHNLSDIEIWRYRNLWDFFAQGRKVLIGSRDNCVLVAGDPWESFVSCLVLRKLSKRKIPIQMQLHADVGSPNWKKLNWKNRARFKVLKPMLHKSNQIRFVSNSQMLSLKKIFPDIVKQSVVIPVPLPYEPNYKENRKNEKKNSIALVGRIHKDRGLEQFIRVCRLVSKAVPNLDIYVVGQGPHQEWLTDRLGKSDLRGRTIFTGLKSQDELSKMWKTFGCVVSFAPAESYGRSAREALLHGVPVMATQSAGLDELNERFKDQGIWFIDNKTDNEIVLLFQKLVGFVVPRSIADSIADEVSTLSEQLADSWLTLSSKVIE